MNTRRIKNIYFLAAFLLVAFFIVFSPKVLAVDDGCTSVLPELRCDSEQSFCVDEKEYNWTSSGYPGGAGNPSCCGDDSQEYYVGCSVHGSGAVCSGEAACCSEGGTTSTNCVYNNTCYSHLSVVNTSDSSIDGEICLNWDVTNFGWVDPDTFAEDYNTGNNACAQVGHTWNSSASYCNSTGPGNICDDADGGGFCCGDDPEETEGKCGTLGNKISANCSGDDVACCDQPACVYNHVCYAGSVHSGVGVQPDLKTLCWMSGDWMDCDEQPGEVEDWPEGSVFTLNQPQVCQACGGQWVASGESNIGEYPNVGSVECCGDDSGEYYITSFCPGASGSAKCCNSATDKIDASGNCVASTSCTPPPTSFSLLSPANNATMISRSPTLTWTASTSGVTYNVYYCCAPTTNCSLPSSPNNTTSGTSWGLSGLNWGDYCRWNIIASNGTQQTSSSNGPWSFRVNQVPNTPVNIAPPGGATGVAVRPTLSWSGGDPDVGDTVTYQVKWCTGASCTPSTQGTVVNSTSFTPGSDFARNTIVRWQITATDAAGATATGAITQFTTVSQVCDPSQPCCSADGLSFKTNGAQPTGLTDEATSCSGTNTCAGSCTIQLRDYYCNGTDADSHFMTSNGAVCGLCSTWVSGLTCTLCADASDCGGTPGKCCSGVCDTNGTGNDTYATDCRTGPACISSGNWGYSAANTGSACGSYLPYCKTPSTCDTWQHKNSCAAGLCTGSFVSDGDTTGTSCSGQSCGTYTDYCLATPGKWRDYISGTGTCSASSEACTLPSYTDYCDSITPRCSAGCQSDNCSTSQCDPHAPIPGLNQTYRQTRAATCGATCICASWEAYPSCQESYQYCNVQCYTGTGCKTANNECYCDTGYTPNGSGGCTSTATYHWDISAWSSCSVSCGTGTQTRTVVCKDSGGNVVADSNCPQPKPATSQACDAGDCTACPSDGCYDPKVYDYPVNTCSSGTCTNNSCTPISAVCSIGCHAECESDNCSTTLCNLDDGYRYLQTRNSTCNLTDCVCGAWSAYQSCQQSYTNCTTDRVQCYTGTGCNTATDACTCDPGYVPNGSSGCTPSATPDFAISLSPASNSVSQGTNATFNLTITPANGFASTVGSWQIDDCPAGATCSVSPSSCASGAYSSCATLTITTTGVTAGTYTSISVGGTGNSLTRWSNSVTLTVSGSSPCTTQPSQPTDLHHTAHTVNSITWAWTAPATGDPPTEYQVYNSSNQLIGTTSGPSYVQTKVSATGANLSANTQYTVYVIAVNSCGSSSASGYASAYTSANTPVSCSGTAVSPTAINWTWVSGGAQDSFYASNSAGNSNWVPGTSWSQIGLTCNTSYTTSVKARNHDGQVEDETPAVQCSATTMACGSMLSASFQYCAVASNTILFYNTYPSAAEGATGWTWNFGDSKTCLSECNVTGYSGTNQNPVHQYTGGASANWWNASWNYRRNIVFNNSGHAAQANFPVLVKQTSADTAFWNHVKSDGSDIRFIDANNSTQLYFEIEKWNYAGKEFVAWVKVPQIDASATDNINLYYGNSSATVSTYKSATNVWDTNFVLVQHLEETSGTIFDSTSSANNGTNNGATLGAVGQANGAASFVAASAQSISIPAKAAWDNLNSFTVEAWVKTSDSGSFKVVLNKDYDFGLSIEGQHIYFGAKWTDDGGVWAQSTDTVTPNVWHHVAATYSYSSSPNQPVLYVDGSAVAIRLVDAPEGSKHNSANAGVISSSNASLAFGGVIDEVRVSKNIRTADWLWLTRATIAGTALTYNAEEPKNTLASSYTVIMQADNSNQEIKTVDLGTAPVCPGCCNPSTPCASQQCALSEMAIIIPKQGRLLPVVTTVLVSPGVTI